MLHDHSVKQLGSFIGLQPFFAVAVFISCDVLHLIHLLWHVTPEDSYTALRTSFLFAMDCLSS